MHELLYLIHFIKARFHAKHYLGSSTELLQRLDAHANGQGACLTRALWEDSEHWQVAALFVRKKGAPLTLREIERRAKVRKNSCDYCPLCRTNPTTPIWTTSYPVEAMPVEYVQSLNLRRS